MNHIFTATYLQMCSQPLREAFRLDILENLLNKFKLVHLLSIQQHANVLLLCSPSLLPLLRLSKPRALHTPQNSWKTSKPRITQVHRKLLQARPARTGGKIRSQIPTAIQAAISLNNFKGRSKTHIPAQIFWWSQSRDSSSPSSGL